MELGVQIAIFAISVASIVSASWSLHQRSIKRKEAQLAKLT